MIKLPAALGPDHELKKITDPSVKKGEKNTYFCPDPDCREVLKVKKGGKYADHFSHLSGSDCTGLETALHLLAKEVLIKQPSIRLPALKFPLSRIFEYFPEDLQGIENELSFSLSPQFYQDPDFDTLFDDQIELTPSLWIDLKNFSIEVEKPEKGFKPDLKITHKKDLEKILFLEVAVSHFIDDRKLQLIKEQNLSFIEYDLSRTYKKGRELTEKQVEEIITQETGIWIHSSRFDQFALQRKDDILIKFRNNLVILSGFYLTYFYPFFKEHIFEIESGAEYKDLKRFWKRTENKLVNRIFKSEGLTTELLKKFVNSPDYKKELKRLEGAKQFLSSLGLEWKDGALKPNINRFGN